jgi:hypothetical protein
MGYKNSFFCPYSSLKKMRRRTTMPYFFALNKNQNNLFFILARLLSHLALNADMYLIEFKLIPLELF